MLTAFRIKEGRIMHSLQCWCYNKYQEPITSGGVVVSNQQFANVRLNETKLSSFDSRYTEYILRVADPLRFWLRMILMIFSENISYVCGIEKSISKR